MKKIIKRTVLALVGIAIIGVLFKPVYYFIDNVATEDTISEEQARKIAPAQNWLVKTVKPILLPPGNNSLTEDEREKAEEILDEAAYISSYYADLNNIDKKGAKKELTHYVSKKVMEEQEDNTKDKIYSLIE